MIDSCHQAVRNGDSLVANLRDVPLSGPSGVAWGLDSPQLNANLVRVRSGEEIGAHSNEDVDVLLLVIAGQGEIIIGDEVHALDIESVVLVPRGAIRSIRSIDQLTYYSVHARREGLHVTAKAATNKSAARTATAPIPR